MRGLCAGLIYATEEEKDIMLIALEGRIKEGN